MTVDGDFLNLAQEGFLLEVLKNFWIDLGGFNFVSDVKIIVGFATQFEVQNPFLEIEGG